MRSDWNRKYRGIGIRVDHRVVRILNDDALHEMLKTNGRYHAFGIALFARHYYRQTFGSNIRISTKSLACEIYWHYYIRIRSEAIEKKWGRKKLTTWLLRHMDVIDCGDLGNDNNRFLWDLLAPFFSVSKRKQ